MASAIVAAMASRPGLPSGGLQAETSIWSAIGFGDDYVARKTFVGFSEGLRAGQGSIFQRKIDRTAARFARP